MKKKKWNHEKRKLSTHGIRATKQWQWWDLNVNWSRVSNEGTGATTTLADDQCLQFLRERERGGLCEKDKGFLFRFCKMFNNWLFVKHFNSFGLGFLWVFQLIENVLQLTNILPQYKYPKMMKIFYFGTNGMESTNKHDLINNIFGKIYGMFSY